MAIIFQNEYDLIDYMIGPIQVVSLRYYNSSNKKRFGVHWFGPHERESLIIDHLAGTICDRIISKYDGTNPYNIHKFIGIAAYFNIQSDGTPWNRLIFIDIDGAGHADGLDPQMCQCVLGSTYTYMKDSGLSPFIDISWGGNGFHVWSLLPDWYPAEFPCFIAKKIQEHIQKLHGVTIEAYPSKPKANPSRLAALPLVGSKPSERGGQIINLDGSIRPVQSIALADRDAVNSLYTVWQNTQKAKSIIKSGEDLILPQSTTSPVWMTGYSLEKVAKALGEINDRNDTELHLNCPRHSSRGRKSLHVVLDKNFWHCHCCNRSGMGPAAGFTLAKWLLPKLSSDADIINHLNTVASTMKGNPHA